MHENKHGFWGGGLDLWWLRVWEEKEERLHVGSTETCLWMNCF